MPPITLLDIKPVVATADAVNDVDNEWNGLSYNKVSMAKQQNRDSQMDWVEHQQIVFDAQSLLVSFTDLMAEQDQASASLGRLKRAYNGSGELLRVTKGIHQPSSDPHIQLALWSANGDERFATYHLNVSATATVMIDDNFQWKAVQFIGYGGDESVRCWPAIANHVNKRNSSRRNSISSPELAKLVNKNNERLAAVAEKIKAKIADDLAHPEKVLQRKAQAMIPILESKGVTLKRHPKGLMEKFLKGEPVTVTYLKKGAPSIEISGTYDGVKFNYDNGTKSIVLK